MVRFEVIGQYFGYPKCCIHWFVESRVHTHEKLTEQQESVHNGTGFLPCPSCSNKVTRDTLGTLIKDRVCSTPFPIDNNDVEFHNYLLKQSIV